MRILHIIRHPGEELGWQVAEAQAGRHEVAVLLLQDGVLSRRETVLPLYASAVDLEARGLPADRGKPLSDAEIVEVLAAHDRLVTW
jgi:sulfur transfer complex TusBCD TusB component (DsrH family)